MDSYRRKGGGYTIIEVMIVLTISVVLFAGAVASFNEQNRRTRFTESVNSFAQNLQDVLNDVETGYYPSGNSFTCTVSGSGININYAAPKEQGKNDACIFLGKAIQFAPDASKTGQINIYTIAGKRTNGTPPKVVTNIDQAAPQMLTNIIDNKFLTADVEIYAVQSVVTPAIKYAGIAMVSAGNSDVSAATSGVNSRATLATIGNSLMAPNFTSLISTLNIVQASDGVNICLREKGDGRKAIIRLASDRNLVTVNVEVDTPCPA